MQNKLFSWRTFGILLCILFALSACQSSDRQIASLDKSEQESFTSEVPEDAVKCLTDFLEALKVSTEDSAQYAYFPNEDIELAHKNSGITLIDYSIEDSRKINDNLYAFDLLQEDSFEPGETYKVWKFIGKLDGTYVVIGNVNYIPAELREGLDMNEYSTNDNSALSMDTIIFDHS